jgi:hypothetical protein
MFGFSLDLRGVEFLISLGLATLALAMLMILRLSGRSGRLSRLSALMAALLLIGTLIALAVAGGNIRPRSDLGTRRLHRRLRWRTAGTTLTPVGARACFAGLGSEDSVMCRTSRRPCSDYWHAVGDAAPDE